VNFLAPFFLLGALAIAGPILFHLIRRTTKEVTPFSTLMFLQPTPPRVTRRSRLENLWLLLLRCAVLGLLALGFARPFLQKPADANTPPPGSGKRLVVLLDTSASMRREALWDEARGKVDALVRAAAPADELAIVAFDRAPRMLVSFEDWRAMGPGERAAVIGERLAAVKPGWAATNLDAALIRAGELLEEPAHDRPQLREVVLISDMQDGARLNGLQGFAWPREVTVTLSPVAAKKLQNAGLHWTSEADDAAPAAEESPLRLRVSNAAESTREQFPIEWVGSGGAPTKLDAYVPAGQSRIVRMPKAPGADFTTLRLTGDDADFDNTVSILPQQAASVPILFLGNDAEADAKGSLYYLRRAFPKTRRQNVEIVVHRGEQAVPAFQLQQAQLLVLGEGVSNAALASARQFASSGRIVVAPLASAEGAKAVGKLLEVPQLSATEATLKNYALFGEIDFQSPLFAAFADPRFSDFTKIHFWKTRKLDVAPLTAAQVLARFDNRDPAIVQAPLGKGSVAILATTWRPADSQLALSSKFVPLLHALLEMSANLPAQKAQYFVGDEVPLPAGTAPLTVRKPDGTEVAAAAAAPFTATDQPGIYAVTPGTLRFAVNLAPEESRLTPFPPERLAGLGVALDRSQVKTPEVDPKTAVQVAAAELEGRQKFWRWLIIAAVAVLLLETLIAAKLSRGFRSSTAVET
jgi:hypothetical protein